METPISKILNKETKVDSDNPFEVFGKSLGLSMVEGLLDNLIDVNNYILFSIGSISYQGNKRNITIGTFGNTFVLPNIKKDKSKDYTINNRYKIIEKPVDNYSNKPKYEKAIPVLSNIDIIRFIV